MLDLERAVEIPQLPIDFPPTEQLPTEPEIRTQKLLDLSPELREFAKQGLTFGHFETKDLNNQNKLESEQKRFHTSMHENGHALVAKGCGWQVLVLSIVQEGNILGYVQTKPNPGKRLDQVLLEKIAICYAGMAAEELLGDKDHVGCGSDFYQAQIWANILSRVDPSYHGHFQQLLEDGKAIARRIITRHGINGLQQASFRTLSNPIQLY